MYQIFDYIEKYNFLIEKIKKIEDENKKKTIFFFQDEILNKYGIIGEFFCSRNKPKFIFKFKGVFLEIIFEKENSIKWCYRKDSLKKIEEVEEFFNLESDKLPENLTRFLQEI
ncbi:MAG: hypothetical protein QXF12_02160 [Candidatus Aenigmatarchaeota archaeon]